VEVGWLLGAPFLAQVIEGAAGETLHVLGGPLETSGVGQRLLDARWRVEVDRPADVVVAGISGDPAHHGLGDMARALACAAPVFRPGAKIALLSATAPPLGQAAEPLRQAEPPEAVLTFLHKHPGPDQETAFLWASAARQAAVYLLSGLDTDSAEEMFTVPMERATQVLRLLEGGQSCVFLPDAHKTMAVVAGG